MAKTSVVIRVEMGKEVRNRVIAGMAECVNDETGFGD